MTGRTNSTDFPTASPLQASFGGGISDAFVTKLSPDGSALVYSTYLGGSLRDFGGGIAVDASGNAYVTGAAFSFNFPTTAGSFQTSKGDASSGLNDVFVTKLDGAGLLVYSTYIGGTGGEFGSDIAVDASGNAYVVAPTNSFNFPTISGVFDTTHNGGIHDCSVTKLSPDGSTLLYSTFLGGSGQDCGSSPGIAVDSSGSAYVAGLTASTEFASIPFPLKNPIQATHAGGPSTIFGSIDAFVTKLNPTGSALVYSTYLGGSGDDFATVNHIAVDASTGGSFLPSVEGHETPAPKSHVGSQN